MPLARFVLTPKAMFVGLIAILGCGGSTNSLTASEADSPPTEQVSAEEKVSEAEEKASLPPLQVDAVVMKWSWVFIYATKDGPISSSALHVPADRNIKVAIRSEDVAHEFVLKHREVATSILPEERPVVSFHSGSPGRQQISCGVHTGANAESGVSAEVQLGETELVVHEASDYESWLSAK